MNHEKNKTLTPDMFLYCIKWLRTSLLVCCFVASAQEEIPITGFVFDNGTPLNSVHITNLNSKNSAISDQNGRYKILMRRSDTLKFSYLGFYEEYKTLEKGQLSINVTLRPKVVELEEVAVSKAVRRKRSQKELLLEYGKNTDLIKTQFGIIDKEAAGYTMYILSEKDFNSNAPDLATAIAGRFPNRGPSNSIYSLSNPNSGPAPIYDVDGMIFTNPPNIMPAAIERIAFIPGLSGATLYGTLGKSGVIIINTKVGTFTGQRQNRVVSPYLNQNVYDGSALDESEAFKYLPEEIKELKQATNFEAAKRIYLNQVNEEDSDFFYPIEALKTIYGNWGKSAFTGKIKEDCFQEYANNYYHLLPLAYVLEEQRDYDLAEQIFKDYLTGNPNKSISYKHLFSLYQLAGNEARAKSISLRYFYLIENGFLPTESDPVSDFFKRAAQNSTGNNERAGLDTGLYLVVEWINPSAQFELQFIGPDNRYFTWRNSEAVTGALLEDFFLDESRPGNWQVNAAYFGNDESTPTYIKLTFYFNYGKNQSSQTMQVRVFRLGEIGLNKKLIRFNTRQFTE